MLPAQHTVAVDEVRRGQHRVPVGALHRRDVGVRDEQNRDRQLRPGHEAQQVVGRPVLVGGDADDLRRAAVVELLEERQLVPAELAPGGEEVQDDAAVGDEVRERQRPPVARARRVDVGIGEIVRGRGSSLPLN